MTSTIGTSSYMQQCFYKKVPALSGNKKCKHNNAECIQKLFFKAKTLVNFYHSSIESVLTGCLALWFGILTAQDCRVFFSKDCKDISKNHCHGPTMHNIYSTHSYLKKKKVARESTTCFTNSLRAVRLLKS